MPDTFVDINNLDTSMVEEISVDMTADAFAPPPPVDDGIHVANIQFQNDEVAKHWNASYGENSKIIGLWTNVKAKIVGGDFDGRQVTFQMISTRVGQNTGTSSAAGLLKALGYESEIAQCRTHADFANLLERALSGNATCKVMTRWEATKVTMDEIGKKSYKVVRRGQKNFPLLKNGKHSGVYEDVDGEEIPARAAIYNYLPLTA